MKRITEILAIGVLSATLCLGAAAMDGGIVDVDTRLNVRTAASSSASVKTKLWDGQVITLHDRSGDWWYVEYAPNSFGYVSATYVDKLNLDTAVVTTASTALNVRESASSTAKIKDKLQKGESVLILGKYGDFYKILYEGNLVGYASCDYLSYNTASIKAINLSVPSYKQYDKVYSSLTLPGSGESIFTHGCAVTSLAMTESYRTDKAVTPKTVLQSEKFTSTGALYWPGIYTQGSASLSYIYSKLSEGKPVIVHVKNSRSGHFVVVYGFSGGAVEAKNFKILDPGSATRKTLADLYADYPIAVKSISY